MTHTPGTVRVGMIQLSSPADIDAAMNKTAQRVREAADRGAQIVCLQELYRSPYFCRTENHDNFSLAETIPGPSTELFAGIARERNIVIIVPVFEKRTHGLYHNAVAVIDAGGALLGTYRKVHIPDDPSFYEKFYFTPGDLGFKVFKTAYGTIGVLICWDQWYPEAARLTALQGAEILFYPTAIGWAESEIPAVRTAQHQAWETIQRSHAIANGVFVCAVNRVGKEGELEFWGQSFVSNPFGELLAKTSPDKEEVAVVDCDLGQIDLTRTHWPFLRDRRIDLYDGITSRFIDGSSARK